MTELEKKIYKCAMEILPEVIDKVKEIQTDSKFIEIPFYCDGCFDTLIYDKTVNMFTKIRYAKGKGSGISIKGMSEFSAYFDEIEMHEIDITNEANIP